MFGYSFAAIASQSTFRPASQSKFIENLGADNLPWVILGASMIIGLIMTGYARLMSVLPRRWAIPIVQGLMAASLVVLWLLFGTYPRPVSIAAYFIQLFMGVLLLSQFWTLANFVYDARQAKRLFGFVYGGAPLGGIVASWLVGEYTERFGTTNWVLVSAGFVVLCVVIGAIIMYREEPHEDAAPDPGSEAKSGVAWGEAIGLLARSRHLQIVALVIAFAAVGGSLVGQQLSMAAQVFKGQTSTDALTTFFAQVQLWMSTIAFVMQVWLTSRIHRLLGIGFALLVLPISFGATGVVMLLSAALWAPALARIADQSLRYTVDKTSREILFLPLPQDLKLKAKPFVDVTVDRLAKGLGAALALVLIKPWGLGLGVEGWQKLSYASLVITVLWVMMAVVARRGYLSAFRQSLERRDVEPGGLRLDVADLSTIETLMTELASPDDQRVLYAIEVLESLDKHNLITPLLLHHESPAVRARVLQAFAGAAPEAAGQWLVSIQKMFADDSATVRAAAAQALANIRHESVVDVLRPCLEDRDPRIATTAAVALARGGRFEDVERSEQLLTQLATSTGDASVAARREVAAALRHVSDTRFRPLLVLLLGDSHPDVAAEAMRSVRALGTAEPLFVPTLVSLLGHRTLKSGAREVLVGYGREALDVLDYLLRDRDEDPWVRRHIPATIARIPCQKSMDILVGALGERDGFLRYKVIAGIEKLHRDDPALIVPSDPIEALAIKEGLRYFNSLTLHYNLVEGATLPGDSLLARALQEKMARGLDRVFCLLGLIYPAGDIAAARHALERGNRRARASASEYLENILSAPIRKRLMGVLEDLPLEEKVRRANVALKTRPRQVEDTLLRLVNDEDQVLAAVAVALADEWKVLGLADDLEHLLVHRRPEDQCVTEAASWTLAGWRLAPGQRRAPSSGPLPVVQVVARLHAMPLFASVSVDELFRIAALGRQTTFEAGRMLFEQGAVPERLQFLLDGGAISRTADGRTRDLRAPCPLGLAELLEGRPMPEAIRTSTTTVCLALDSTDMWALMVDSAELVRGLFGLLASGPEFASRCVLRGRTPTDLGAFSHGGLTPIEKVLALQRVPAFATVGAADMRHLASIAREVPLDAPTIAGDPGQPAVHVILAGRVSFESTSGDTVTSAGPGDVIGMYETLAGRPVNLGVRVREPGRLLRIDGEELFDVVEQRPYLLQQIFNALFRGRVDRVPPQP